MRISALLASFSLLFALLPASVSAGSSETLTAAHAQQLAVYRIVRDFHMQTLLSGDPARAVALKAAVAAQDKTNAALGAPTGNATADAALKRAQAEWPTFRKLALANNIASAGYTDDNLVLDLYESTARIDKALAEAITALKPGEVAVEIHAANMLLQHTTTRYLKRAAQTAVEVGGGEDFDIAAAAERLDGLLLALQKRLAGNKDAAAALRDVMGKWKFIKPRLINYNEQTVPYIVDRYAQQMSDGLSQLATQAAGK